MADSGRRFERLYKWDKGSSGGEPIGRKGFFLGKRKAYRGAVSAGREHGPYYNWSLFDDASGRKRAGGKNTPKP